MAMSMEVLNSFLSEPNFYDYENLSTLIRIISSEITQDLIEKAESMAC